MTKPAMIRLDETTKGYISVWTPERFCGYVGKAKPHRAYALRNGCEIVGDFESVRDAIRAVASNASK